MYTKAQFDAAVAMLIGAGQHSQMAANGFNRADFCRKVAEMAFVGRLRNNDAAALELVRWAATNLWIGDGSLGLTD